MKSFIFIFYDFYFCNYNIKYLYVNAKQFISIGLWMSTLLTCTHEIYVHIQGGPEMCPEK